MFFVCLFVCLFVVVFFFRRCFVLFCLFVCFLICFYVSISVEESVFVTVLNAKSLKADDKPQFQCYRTMGESTERTYGRYVRTRGGTGNTKNLPPHSPQRHCCVDDANIVRMDETDRNGFGIFFCRGTQPNKIITTVPTILMRSDGKHTR